MVLDGIKDRHEMIESVDYEGYYEGYDENGDGLTRDWHGFTKNRRPVAILGTAARDPFAATWDLTMLPAQENMAVRAVVHFKGRPDLVYVTPETRGLRVPKRPGVRVELVPARDLPVPFLVAGQSDPCCSIVLDATRLVSSRPSCMSLSGTAGPAQSMIISPSTAGPFPSRRSVSMM